MFRDHRKQTIICLQKDVDFKEQDVVKAYCMLLMFLEMLDNGEGLIKVLSQESDLCLEDIC